MPAWVKVFLAIGLAVLVLAVTLLVAGGDHGPGRHVPLAPQAAPSGPDAGSAAPEIEPPASAGKSSVAAHQSR